jgi:dTMP kinase
MSGFFISFEGNEGSGKSTQIGLLAERLRRAGRLVTQLREPGGTPIGEEIRHTLKHSSANHAMTPETELLLMNASRAQLVREVIRPALAGGHVVLCDRFYDSTVVYQGYGRGLPMNLVLSIIEAAVGETRPDLTLLLDIPLATSELRRISRLGSQPAIRDRFEEAERSFFERIERGYRQVAAADPRRIQVVDATRAVAEVHEAIWQWVAARLPAPACGAS